MKRLIVATLACALSVVAQIPKPGFGGGGAGTAAPPYGKTFSAVTTITATAAQHGAGTTAIPGDCWDNATPNAKVALTAGYPQRAANGDITWAWTGSKTGTCYVWSASASGSAGGDLAGTYPNPTITQSGVTQHQAALSIATSQLTGTLADARVAQSNVTQHQAALALATSQITSGTLADARVAESNVTQHQAALSLAASQIGSGILGLARGGTNNATWTAGRCVQVSADGTKLEVAAAACGTGGGGTWGGITGTLSDQTDLQEALDGKAAAVHSHNLQDLGGAVTDAQVPDNIAVDWAGLLNVPSEFTPSAHASSHTAGGTDAVDVRLAQINSADKAGDGTKIATTDGSLTQGKQLTVDADGKVISSAYDVGAAGGGGAGGQNPVGTFSSAATSVTIALGAAVEMYRIVGVSCWYADGSPFEANWSGVTPTGSPLTVEEVAVTFTAAAQDGGCSVNIGGSGDDIGALTEITSVDGAADYFVVLDATDGLKKKVLGNNLPSSGGGVSDGDKGDIVISGTGTVYSIDTGVIVNADINASAAIAVSKLAAVTASRALVSDASGFLSAATTTATEIGYVNGVTSAIQTQLNAKQASDGTLTALASYNTNGILVQTAADTFAGRTLTGPAAGISVTNGNGVSGNPTLALANDLAAVEGLSANGMAARTGTDTWAARTITGTSNEIAVTNGDGVSGNPTLALASTVNLSSKVLRIPNSTSLPGTCTVGDIYMDTDATSGQRLYLCQATNTWALQGDGGGGASVAGSDTQVQFNDGGAFGGDAGMTYNKTTDVLTVTGGIVSGGGSAAGLFEFGQGTAATPSANSSVWYAPTSIATAYGVVVPDAVGASGVVKVGVSGAVATLSFAALTDSDVPDTITASNYQPVDTDLTAVAGLSSNGIIARTGSGTAAVRTITGTLNEIGVSNGDGVSGNPTLSMPSVLDLGGKTSFEMPNSSTPTVDAFGEIAGDSNIWGTGRGAPIFYDGTAAVALVGTLVSDTPTNGQVPTWKTGGTIEWESVLTNPMTTAEDIIVGGSSGTPGRLAAGAEGTVLKIVSGVVAWGTDSTGGSPAFSDVAAGTNTNALVVGTGGSLTVSGSGTINATSLGGTAAASYALLASPVFTSSLALPQGTGPTVDAAGEIAVDTTTDQLQFYGGAKRALPSIMSSTVVIAAPATTDDINIMKAPYGMTIVGIDAIIQGGTNVVGQLQECNSSGASCADLDSDITVTTSGAADDGSLTDSAIASGGWLRWKTTSVSGTVDFLTVTFRYRVVAD
jgi:hypothetical protein